MDDDFPSGPFIDANWEALAKLDTLRAQARSAEALRHLADLRKSIGDPFASIIVSVLRPACAHCVREMTGREPFGGATDTIMVHPIEVAGFLRLYSPNNCQYTLVKTGRRRFRYTTECYLCWDTVPVDTNEFTFAIPDPYDDYFGLKDDGPISPPKWFKKELWRWYDRRCFLCHNSMALGNVTIDHIVPKDSPDGTLGFSNLQPLCGPCNNEKKRNTVGPQYRVYLDFLLRPAPSDSYEGLLW